MVVGLVCAWALIAPASCFAIAAPIHIANTNGEGAYIRPEANTVQPAIGWMPEGASPDYICFVWGQEVNGVPIWFNVSYAGVTGYYASAFDDSSYQSNSELTAKYGVPECGASAAPPASGAALPGSPPAASPQAVSCYGDYCSGKDPGATHCSSGAVTSDFEEGAGLRLELRWSPRCKTNWARLVIYPRYMGPGELWAEQSTGYRQNVGVGAGHYRTATAIWSPMIYSPKKCVKANFVFAPGYAWNVWSTRCR